jgi:hypothetical protein
MQEVTIKLTPDALNVILQALNHSVLFQQQNTAMLINSLQSQANAQIQPVVTTPQA